MLCLLSIPLFILPSPSCRDLMYFFCPLHAVIGRHSILVMSEFRCHFDPTTVPCTWLESMAYQL